MSGYRRLNNVVHWLALVLWSSALIAAVIAAVNVFGVLPEEEVRLERFAAIDDAEHGRLAAGLAMERVFATTDMLQALAAPLVIITLALELTILRGGAGHRLEIARAVMVLLATATLIIYLLQVAPRMNRELRAYWTAAEAGDNPAALERRAAFDRLHPTGETLQGLTLLLVLTAVGLSAASQSRPLQHR